MYNIYLSGNTFDLKEEIKELKPKRKDFKGWWKYNYDFKSWEINIPNNIISKKFLEELQNFTKKHKLKIEIYEFTNNNTKSIKDYDNIESFFQDFHNNNSRKYYK